MYPTIRNILVGAYIPMAFLAGKLAERKKK